MKTSHFVRATTFGAIAVLLASVAVRSVISAPSATTTKKATRALPVTQAKAGQETATIAAGCFWSMDATFRKIRGVSSVEPGYAGGTVKNPSYEAVCTGTTGHAETINVIYDPKVVSYATLLRVLMTTNDPTTLNRQGADEGTQYRSAIFTRNAAQKTVAADEIRKMNASKLWRNPVVTQVVAFSNFYRAEDYHLNYYNRNPNVSYSKVVIAPKIAKFEKKFGSLTK